MSRGFPALQILGLTDYGVYNSYGVRYGLTSLVKRTRKIYMVIHGFGAADQGR
jgi:hypothetical protein